MQQILKNRKKTGQKKQTKYLYELLQFFQKNHFHFHRVNILEFIKNCFLGYTNTQEKSEIIILQKKEWVLDGETVLYGNAAELRETLEYDFTQERQFSYKGLSTDEIIHHLAYFISRLWQIHIFGEGNTRTTAVFFIKYLRSLGYDATNDIFAENAWYFRNALVRANYTNLSKDVHETTVYLEVFIRNLLLNENNELKNRYLHINNLFKIENKAICDKNVANGDENVAIEYGKQAIEEQIAGVKFNIQTKNNITKLYSVCGIKSVFGRSDVSNICCISYSAAGNLIAKMKEHKFIEEVKGFGKGKYRFIEK